MDAPADRPTELLRHLAEGDVRGAAHLLVLEHADEVFGLCRAMVRDATTAEDLSQDVFTRAFAALPNFRGDASTRTWILRITRNRCIDHLRAKQRHPGAGWDDAEPDAQPDTEPDVAELLTRREDVTRALECLDEGERALVVLRFGHGLDYPALADAFGIKQGTARMRISRAVVKMRRAVEAGPADEALFELDAPAESRARFGAAPASSAAPPFPQAPPASPSMGAPPGAPAPASPAPRRSGGIVGRVIDFFSGSGPNLPEPPPPSFSTPAPTTLRARLANMLDELTD